MSSQIFEDLTAKYPAERRTLEALERFLRAKAAHYEMTLDHLAFKVEPASVEALAVILVELANAGFIRRVFRVESPTTQAGVADFDSVQDVPKRLHDWHTDTDFDVTPKQVRVFYSNA